MSLTITETSCAAAGRTGPLLIAICLGIAITAGCTTVSPEAGFGEVSRLASQRLGQRVHWNTDTPEDAKVAESVRALLKEELTAEAAVQVALLNNRDLQATYEDLGVAQAALVQAGLLSNPVLAGNYKFGIGGPGPEAEGDLVMNFLEIFYLPLRKRVAKADFEAAKLRVTLAVMDLAHETRIQFYEVQAGEQMLEMRHQVVEATGASLDLAERLHRAGNIRDLDLDNERALHSQARLDLAEAEAAVRRNREQLNGMMGLWGENTLLKIPARLPEIAQDEITSESLEQRAITQSLDLAVVRQRMESAARTVGLARATALFPDLDLGPAGKREVDGNWLLGPALSLPLPFFDWGRAKVAAAEAELRRGREHYFALAVQVRSAVRAAWDQLQAARSRALFYRNIMLPLRHRTVEESQLEYNGMQIGAFQLLQAKQQEIDAGREYLAALRDYWAARAGLEQILNGRLSDLGPGSDSLLGMPKASAMTVIRGGH